MTVRAGFLPAAALFAASACLAPDASAEEAPDPGAVLRTYADIAEATYTDALTTAGDLAAAVDQLLAQPSTATQQAAKDAWRAARVPYLQSEAFRFGNPIVDDWEGRVNSWPLDEGLIDYVAPSYGTEIRREQVLRRQRDRQPEACRRRQDVRCLDDRRRSCCARCRRSTASRPTSRPAITRSSSCSGARICTAPGRAPASGRATDYALGDQCTGGHCDRRARLSEDGDRSAGLRPRGNGRRLDRGRPRRARRSWPTRRKHGLTSIVHRARQPVLWRARRRAHEARPDAARPGGGAGLLLRQHAQLALLRRARHPERLSRPATRRVDGSMVQGPSLADLVRAKDPALDAEMRAKLDATDDGHADR